jgi:hypothetical protein
MLTTAGPGQVPRSVFANITSYITVLEYFNDLPKLGRATLFDHPGRLDDWRAMAERGLYAFDFMCISRQTTGYRLVSRPQEALLLSAIPSRIQKYFDAVRFSTVSFADAGEDALNLTVETIEWL